MNHASIFLTLVGVLISTISSFAQDFSQSPMTHAAPEKCWTYAFWNAAGKYESTSENHSERLLAEPEIKAFVDDVINRIGYLGSAMAVDQPKQKRDLINVIGPLLTDTLFRRAGCFFVEDVKINRDQEFEGIAAVLMMDAGDEAGKLTDHLVQLMSFDTEQTSESVTIEGVKFHKSLINDQPKTELLFGHSNGTLMFGLGEKAISGALKRVAAKQTPSWLKEFQSTRRIERVTSLGYFNVKEIRDNVMPFFGGEGEMFMGIAGLSNIDSVETCSGFSQQDSVSRMLIRTDGDPEGLLDLSSSDGILSADLQQFPSDALFAVGLSIDPGKVFRYTQIASLQLNRNRDSFGRMLSEIKRETGIDVRRDIVDTLGKTWTLHNGAGDGWMTGLTLTGSVKDGPKLSAALNRVIKTILKESGNDPYAPKFTKRKVGDDEIFTVRFQGVPLPFEPSWCVTNERVLIGLYPQAVQSALTNNSASALIDQSEFSFLTQPFGGKLGDSKLVAMAYSDTATQFEFTYPYLQMMLSMSQSMVEGFDLPGGASQSVSKLLGGVHLPPTRTIHRHLQPSYLAVRQTELGMEFESRQTIPALDASFIAPLAVGMLLPAVQQVRGSARRTVSMNNIRQQALASLNYESAFQRWPAGYSTNQQGEKLLSWRVHILPFIEENNLYQQFKLDEPWDSDNNKRLLEQMPEVFRSPVSKAKPGMTVYRGVGGKMGVLGAPAKPDNPGGVRFGQMTDGSSNTFFVVETSDQLAIEWTKPDEGLNPEDFDLDAIFGQYPGGTNAGYCDGSVRFIPDSIPKETFQLLMQMNDGHVVPDFDNLSDRPSRQRQRNNQQADEAQTFVFDNGVVELTIDNMLTDEEKAVLAEREKVDTLREITIGMHNFHDAYQKFPSAYSVDEQGQPLLSWRVHLLPYLDEVQLYKQFRLNEPWDSDHNRTLLEKIPAVYNLSEQQAALGKTTVLANGGPSGPIQKPKAKGQASNRAAGFASMTDGTSNTILLVDAGDTLAVEWTKPTEFVPDDKSLKIILGQKNGFATSISDGSTKNFPAGFPLETFRALLTMNGGEILGDWRE